MIVKATATRAFRKHMARKVIDGLAELRVTGNEDNGYNLVAQHTNKQKQTVLTPLFQARRFKKQGQAIAFGFSKYGAKARKLLKTAA